MKNLTKEQCLLLTISNSLLAVSVPLILGKASTVSALSISIVTAIFGGLALGFAIGLSRKKNSENVK